MAPWGGNESLPLAASVSASVALSAATVVCVAHAGRASDHPSSYGVMFSVPTMLGWMAQW